MASSRKKQDEKNLKTLRELVSLPPNKYCFDCNQRGPTYVNVTIGSFVCTKCSGMLRGLTPPHRVKSISMATFTAEEIDLIKNRGNDFCKRVWLGLHEGSNSSELRDEQTIRDFMVDKYERKRYYLEPSQTPQNGYATPINVSNKTSNAIRPLNKLVTDPKPLRIETSRPVSRRNETLNGNNVINANDFVADFASADIFSAVNNNSSNNSGGSATQPSFANFDNNPIFNNTSMPTPSALNSMSQQQQHKQSVVSGPPAPPEDRYAALKDLDNALKAQPTLDWNSGSNSSLYSSPTPAGSVYSSPSPQSSAYGSPSQGQFASVFPSQDTNNSLFNPFNGNTALNKSNSFANGGQTYVNPFRTNDATPKMNGFFPSPVMQTSNNSPWSANPFKINANMNMGTMSNGHSNNNPFL